MHPTEGDLRAYTDGELSGADLEWITAHLATCTECQQQADQLRQRALWTQQRLALLAPEQPPLSARAARARLASYSKQDKETPLMKTLSFARQYRPLWSGLAIAAMLLLALLLPPVRALATDFLGLFRIQRIEVVEVNPDDLPEPFANSAVQVEQLLADNIQVERRGEPSETDSAATASTLAGFPVRLPAAATGERRIRVQPGAQLTLDIDLPRVRTLLRELGHAEIALPDSLDGKQVIVDIPQAVTTAYGTCQDADANAGAERSDPCVVLMQLPSPTVSAPPELDMKQLGAAFLQMMGRNEEDAALFSQQVDWSTTLVVPNPSSYTDYEEVQVDGVPGILIEKLIDENVPRFMLLWVREGIVYALIGA
ncbi:MAG: zf-HC2 domain-containing protein, partial [Chloroflexota bacterium]|nr:zf-HC2 domain-containing protein [Chloroflexota bacterium]